MLFRLSRKQLCFLKSPMKYIVQNGMFFILPGKEKAASSFKGHTWKGRHVQNCTMYMNVLAWSPRALCNLCILWNNPRQLVETLQGFLGFLRAFGLFFDRLLRGLSMVLKVFDGSGEFLLGFGWFACRSKPLGKLNGKATLLRLELLFFNLLQTTRFWFRRCCLRFLLVPWFARGFRQGSHASAVGGPNWWGRLGMEKSDGKGWSSREQSVIGFITMMFGGCCRFNSVGTCSWYQRIWAKSL